MMIYDNQCLYGKFHSYYNFKQNSNTLFAPELMLPLKNKKNNTHNLEYDIIETDRLYL